MIASRISLLRAGLLAAALASTGAFAQAPAAPAAEAPVAKGHHPHEGHASHFAQMQQRHARHLAVLKGKLKITPEQEAAWTAFTEAQKPPTPPAGPRMGGAEFAKLATPQRLDLMEKRQADRSAEFAKRISATRTFYAALTPEQQKVFDSETMRRFGSGEHGGPRRRAPAKH